MTLKDFKKAYKLNVNNIYVGEFKTCQYKDTDANICFLGLGKTIVASDSNDAEEQDRVIMSKGLADDYRENGLAGIKDAEVLYSPEANKICMRRNSGGVVLSKDCSSLFD